MKKRIIIVLSILMLPIGQHEILAQIPHIISTKSTHGDFFLGDSEIYSKKELDKEVLRITYRSFLAFADTNEDGVSGVEVLQIGHNTSKYQSKIHLQMDSIIMRSNNGRFAFNSINGIHKINPIFIYECYYTDFGQRKITYTNRLSQDDFLFEETIPTINWKIIKDSLINYLGYNCTKAVGKFRGRTYEVWYTEAIPSSVGPWKLGGLPGTILLAKDSESNCRFEAISIVESNDPIILPEYPYITITRKKYGKLLRQRILKPDTFFIAHGNKNPNMRISAEGPEIPQRMICFLEKE